MEENKRSYAKKKHKTAPIGIRFNIKQLGIAITKSGKDTKQELVDWLVDRYVNGESPILERQQPMVYDAPKVPNNYADEPKQWQEPKLTQFEAYALEIQQARNFGELKNTVESFVADKSLTKGEKVKLEQFAEHVRKEKGFEYND